VLWDTENLFLCVCVCVCVCARACMWKLSVKIILQTSHTHTSAFMAFSRTELPPESVRINTDKIKGQSLRIGAVGGVATRVNEQPGRSRRYQKWSNWWWQDNCRKNERVLSRFSRAQWAAPNLILSDCSIYTVKNILYLC